jgi:splicing factor U2AF subunit
MNVPSGPSQYRDKYRSNVSSDAPRGGQRQSVEPKETLPPEQQIAKIEKDLEKYGDVPLIEEIKVLDSRWGTKPKGFENVTAQRAKLSGLFPLPGYPRPVDFTKLEGLLKEESSDLLTETSKINPIDSNSARTLIIKNVPFERISYLKIVEFFNDYLKHIDIPETTQHNISSKRKSKDDKTLIIEFSNNTCATVIFTMNKLKLPFNLYKEDTEARIDDDEQIELIIERPHEYVVQALPSYDKINEEDIEESVTDNPRKMTIHVSSELTESNITDELKKIASVKGFQLPRELGTKKPVGIAFFEFYIDPQITDTTMVISKLEEYLEKVKTIQFVSKAYFSCIIPGVTSIQDCVADYSTLRLLARNEQVTVHPKLRIIQLLNCVTAKDLMEDASYQFIYKDIMQEVSKIGKVKSIKIPRPANDYTPGLQQFSEPGLGKIFVEFEDDEVAFKAIMSLAGRQYNDRTVLCAFYDGEDYRNGLF